MLDLAATNSPQKRLFRTPYLRQLKSRDKASSLEPQLFGEPLTVESSKTTVSSQNGEPYEKVCSNCQDPGYFCTPREKNEHQNTKSTFCRELGPPESRQFKKPEKCVPSAKAVIAVEKKSPLMSLVLPASRCLTMDTALSQENM